MGYIPSWEKLPHVVEARRIADEVAEPRRLASAHTAASRIQRYAIIEVREQEGSHRAVEKKTDPQGSTADPTLDKRLVEVAEEIVDRPFFVTAERR